MMHLSAIIMHASALHWLGYSRPRQHTGAKSAVQATARQASPGAGWVGAGMGVGTGTTGGTGGASGQGQA